MEPITISVDMDGTLADFITPALGSVNSRFGTGYTPASFPSMPFEPHLPSDHRDHFKGFVADPQVYASLDPLPEGISGVLALASAGYPIIITSHRPPESLRSTRDWLLRQGIPYLGLEVSYGSKAQVAARYGPDRPLIFIDDDPSLVQALGLPRPGIQVWLLEHLHTGVVDTSLCRIFPGGWPQVAQALLEAPEHALGAEPEAAAL